MKKNVKLRISAIIIIAILLTLIVLYFVSKQDNYEPHPVRPKDFPEILIAPENAVLYDHSTPADSKRAQNIYDLTFLIKNTYPSEETRNFYHEYLRSRGWRKIKYDLLNLYGPSRTPKRPLPKQIPDIALKNFIKETKKQKGGKETIKRGIFPISWSQEEWLNNDNEYISIHFSYSADLHTGEVNHNKLSVYISYFQNDTWIYPYILRYKKMYPEEFEDANNISDPNKAEG